MIAPPVDRGLIAAAKDVATDSGNQFHEVDRACKFGGYICGDGEQSRHDHTGGGAYPAQDAGGCGKDGGGGFFRHQAGEKVGDQVDAAPAS